ncbi:MAG: epoxide hydrolase family protein [Myxococcota bacterium]
MADANITPFRIEVADDELEDLKRRLRATRWPEPETVEDDSQGIPLAYVQDVCSYWADGYDWRKREAALNELPQFSSAIDGCDVHFVHVRSPREDALPLLMTHGWPGSFVEFLDVIGPLSDPEAHGASGEPAFHVVCPSLPGFGFSGKPSTQGWGALRIANAWTQLVRRLGYDRYVAQGGDWGSLVTTCIGHLDPEHCAAIHVNMPIVPPDPETMDDLTPAEQAGLASMQEFQEWGTGYSKQQCTRPQTLGYGLADSPAGQAAWILEKFWFWSDCNGHPENVFSRDRLLDNVMLYWLPGTAASSARLYWESFRKPPTDPVRVPVGCSMFRKEIFYTSRRWAEKHYGGLLYWNELDQGGHFAAMEQPASFVAELRAFARALREAA